MWKGLSLWVLRSIKMPATVNSEKMVSSFKEIIQYISITLSIFSLLTVAGIFILRKTHKERPFHMPFYPVTPLIFIIVTCWMIYYMFREDPKIIFYSLATMIPGVILYFSVAKSKKIES